MKVSIITVTLNSDKYLEECINSVIGQDYNNIEHIIIDGKSSDGTVEIIKKYEKHLSHWLSEKDIGMYDAINKGIELAKGDIIGLLNSDDLLASNDVISIIVKVFAEQKVDSIFGDLQYVEADDTKKLYRTWKDKAYNRKRFLSGWMPAHPTFYLKRTCIEKYGGYENHYYTAADYEFMARYLYKYRLSAFYIPKLIVTMRRGGQSNKNLFKRLRANRRDFLAMKKNDIPFPFLVSILKPLSKLHQYLK
ncbi:MAG: glycosyltransferase family 2 protein [Ferruginibacter sp.]